MCGVRESKKTLENVPVSHGWILLGAATPTRGGKGMGFMTQSSWETSPEQYRGVRGKARENRVLESEEVDKS